MENEIKVVDAKDRSRYEALDADGTLMGFVDYKLHPGVIVFLHAETLPDYILILPWNLKDEITAQLGYAREWGARFVIPIPRVEVL